MDVGNLISDSSAFSKTSLNIWKFTVHVLLKPGLENFENYFTSMWEGGLMSLIFPFWVGGIEVWYGYWIWGFARLYYYSIAYFSAYFEEHIDW